jgi:hypothetical protein
MATASSTGRRTALAITADPGGPIGRPPWPSLPHPSTMAAAAVATRPATPAATSARYRTEGSTVG